MYGKKLIGKHNGRTPCVLVSYVNAHEGLEENKEISGYIS